MASSIFFNPDLVILFENNPMFSFFWLGSYYSRFGIDPRCDNLIIKHSPFEKEMKLKIVKRLKRLYRHFDKKNPGKIKCCFVGWICAAAWLIVHTILTIISTVIMVVCQVDFVGAFFVSNLFSVLFEVLVIIGLTLVGICTYFGYRYIRDCFTQVKHSYLSVKDLDDEEEFHSEEVPSIVVEQDDDEVNSAIFKDE